MLPGHSFILQALLSSSVPVQSFPPWDAAFKMILVRVWSPSPHVLEQLLHPPKSLQVQLTVSAKSIYLLLVYQIVIWNIWYYLPLSIMKITISLKILKISISERVYKILYLTGTFFDFAMSCFFFKSCTIVSSIFCCCFNLSSPLLWTSTTTDRAVAPLPILTPTAVNFVCNQNETYIGSM